MSLREYRRKRHFERTPEPDGTTSSKGGHSFVVQKHQARNLHYDFRLELDGVLKSWAVPKGPCLDPSVKRLAMHVEDHPVAYGSFEGIIPQGEYGAGTVMLWDRGDWEPIGDSVDGYRNGRLKFKLHGNKLRGGWMLIRTGGRRPSDRDSQQWLLFKERDDDARPQDEGDILEQQPLSVSTGRSLDEIAADQDRQWMGKESADGPRKKAVAHVPDATGTLPRRVNVQLATLVKAPPDGNDWLHEIKFDGYRMVCLLDHGQVRFRTRNHKDWTDRLSFLQQAAARLPAKQAILDGEVVALRPDGTSSFQDLQNAFRDRRADALCYYCFDLLHLDGLDCTAEPLQERKRRLAELLTGCDARIRLSEHVEGNGAAFFEHGCHMGLEGIISKRRDAPYRPGRGLDWLKIKCVQKDEFVIGGYTEPGRSRTGFGALLIGYHDARGNLVYAGKVGTGFDEKTLRSLRRRLEPLRSTQSPFRNFKRATAKTHWVRPTLVAQVAFGAWTNDGRLRHASFQGLREDKAAADVTRENAKPIPRLVKPQDASAATVKTKDHDRIRYDARNQQFAGVRLTSPDKVLYPEQGITKLELAEYYRDVADWLLPHVINRPLVLVRCPEGRAKACFYQKHPPVGTPDTLRQILIREEKKTEPYVVVDDVAGLISLAQIGALEIHAWGSHADKLERPDRLVFDLDPDPAVPWAKVVQSARQVRMFLQELGLKSFVKTTGGKGLHLVAPIERRHTWDEVKAFCKRVADLIAKLDPRSYTANMAKAARAGKIYLDYLRNGRGATAIVPYSPRARPGAPVATPLTWEELTARTPSDRYTVRNIRKRLASLKRDPWEGFALLRQGLAHAAKRLALQ